MVQIVENHEWPTLLMDNVDSASEEKMSQVVHYLFPPEAIISTLKEGLKVIVCTYGQAGVVSLLLVYNTYPTGTIISRYRLG